MGILKSVRKSSLAQLLRQQIPSIAREESFPLDHRAFYQDLLHALALVLETKGRVTGLANELLRREGRYWGEIGYARSESIGSLIESGLRFRQWLNLRIGEGALADYIRTSVDQSILAALEAYFDNGKRAGREQWTSMTSAKPQEPTATETKARHADSRLETVGVPELEGQILRELERFGRIRLATVNSPDAQTALRNLLRKELVVPSIGAGIELQVTETGRFMANLGQRG